MSEIDCGTLADDFHLLVEAFKERNLPKSAIAARLDHYKPFAQCSCSGCKEITQLMKG